MHKVTWSKDDIIAHGVSATVGGKAYEVLEFTGDRELTRSFPGQTSLQGGVSAATGVLTVRSAGPEAVTSRTDSPWGGPSYPSVGERVSVSVSNGTESVPLFVGSVDEVRGQAGEPEIEIHLVDDYDKLNAPVSHLALARTMPPRSTTGEGSIRRTGLLSCWITDLAARAAGFYATPRQRPNTVVSAPLQGSTWPERGVLLASYRTEDAGLPPGSRKSQHPHAGRMYGSIGMSNLLAVYETDPFDLFYAGTINATHALNLTAMFNTTLESSAFVSARWGLGFSLRIGVTPSRNIKAQFVTRTGEVKDVATLGAAEAGDWRAVTVRFKLAGTSSLQATIKTDTGATVTEAFGPDSAVFQTPPDNFAISAPAGTSVAGFQASYSDPEATKFDCDWTRSFYHYPSSPLKEIYLVPGLVQESAEEILRSQSEAEGSALWIDEYGVLQYRDRSSLMFGNPVGTLTSAKDLLSLDWSSSSKDVHSRVTVKYREPLVSVARRSVLVAYEGHQEEFRVGDYKNELITPPTDEEWIAVDTTPREVYGDTSSSILNSGEGTIVGWTAINSKGDEMPRVDGTDPAHVTSSGFIRVNTRAWRYEFSVDSLGSGVRGLVTQTPSEDSTQSKKRYRGLGLPLVRCMARGRWTDQQYTTGTTGPSSATAYEHDASWFIQREDHAKSLADEVAAQTSAPRPILRRIAIRPDPRIQLGDRMEVSDPDVTGIQARGTVISLHHKVTPEHHDMEVTVLVNEVSTPYATLDEYDRTYMGLSLAGADQKFLRETLAQKDSNPIRK